MKVLVTGANGFIGRNLVESLKCLRDGKDRRERYGSLLPLEVRECDKNTTAEELRSFCGDCDFVFHLAGVNRPKDDSEFQTGNAGFTEELLGMLENAGNTCPVMLASSAQASLQGRFEGSVYGQSKLQAERLVREHGEKTGAKALIYRFPNVYGKWCRPNYNSAVATFCHNKAHGLPIQVNDPRTELELLYIDDLVEEMLQALIGNENEVGEFCQAQPTDKATLGQIVDLLDEFSNARSTLGVPDVTDGSFSKKLYSTYLSYLDPQDFVYDLKPNVDERGSFTELLRTEDRGQVSINVSKPGITKGQHWHHAKWEKFCVVSGEALIRLRKVGVDEQGKEYPVTEYAVSGNKPVVVEMIPGYTHSITNVSSEKDLVTVMWANECFDKERPDTFFEEV